MTQILESVQRDSLAIEIYNIFASYIVYKLFK